MRLFKFSDEANPRTMEVMNFVLPTLSEQISSHTNVATMTDSFKAMLLRIDDAPSNDNERIEMIDSYNLVTDDNWWSRSIPYHAILKDHEQVYGFVGYVVDGHYYETTINDLRFAQREQDQDAQLMLDGNFEELQNRGDMWSFVLLTQDHHDYVMGLAGNDPITNYHMRGDRWEDHEGRDWTVWEFIQNEIRTQGHVTDWLQQWAMGRRAIADENYNRALAHPRSNVITRANGEIGYYNRNYGV